MESLFQKLLLALPEITALLLPILIYLSVSNRITMNKLVTRFDQFLQNGGTSTKTLDKLTEIEIRCKLNHPNYREAQDGKDNRPLSF